jgi:transposase
MTTKPAPKTPAVETIAAFARAGLSIRGIARRLKVHPSTVLRWQQSDNGAGNVPSRYHRRLLALAAETGAEVTERTLINGS